MRSALVLNATFEPLSIVPARRAICLVLSDKAEIVEEDGTQIRAETFVMPGPLVIRLRYVVKVPYHRRTAMSRRAIFARDNHRCQYCGAHADSIDHVMPRSRGGMHVW
jgi:5-methylcytosine-specific restriction endonuclease McrA